MKPFGQKATHGWIIGHLLAIVLVVWAGCAPSSTVQSEKGEEPENNSAIRIIEGVDIQRKSDSLHVIIRANQPLTYTSVKQPGQAGISLYFPETGMNNLPMEFPGDSAVVRHIVASKMDVVPPATRIDIDLFHDVPYEVIKAGNDLTVVLQTASRFPLNEAQTLVDDSQSPDSSQESGYAITEEQAKKPKSDRVLPVQHSIKVQPLSTSLQSGRKMAWLDRIDFSADDSGKAMISLGTTQPVAYRVEKIHPKQIRLQLEKTRLSENRKYPLITDRFRGAVNRIVPSQASKAADITYVTVDLRESVPYQVEQKGSMILVKFDPSIVTPEASLQPGFQELPKKTSLDMIETHKPGPEMAESSTHVPKTMVEKKKSDIYRSDGSKVYTGEKIAIDFFDTDIRNVFKIIAEMSGKNFAIDPEVKGKITLALEKPVPWDQVLDMVLRMNGLDKVEEGDIIRIATLSQLQKEQESRKKLMMAEKASQDQMVELEPLVTEYLPINYAKAADEMKPHLDGLLTPGRGTLTVDARTNQLIMTDVSDKIRKAKEIIQKLDRVTPQVVIEAKIVEASTDFSRELGVTWDAMGGIQGTDAQAGIGPQKGFNVLNGTYGWDAAVNFPIASANNGQIGINFTKIAGTPLVINARLYAMENNNQGRIISSPKILTMDNKEAFIEQGVEVGYTEKGRTDEVPSVKFKKVTLNLKVTPHVTLDNRISMKIELVKDDILSYFQGVPIINTKKASTELLVDDGDTLVIGGITKNSDKESESGVPGLAKIPLLGWLFKTKSDDRTNEELLIFMTPRIVQLEQRALNDEPGKG